MKQGRLTFHTRSYNATMSNEAKKTHCSHKELQCYNGNSLFTQGVTMQQWLMKQGKLIVHTRSYNATMGKEARKTHWSHKE
ncbi:hypothetical protein KSS87_009693, partial [Heliosperma pusillum]